MDIIKNRPKVSIIVPVFNVEEYLSRCIESLINQTYENLEIILLNDGSTDRSLELARRYKNKDKRIVLITKNNTGVSDTRNKGIDIANGEFIIFVDSDDWIDKNMIEKMITIQQKYSSEVVICSYISEFRNKSILKFFDSKEGKYKIDYITRKLIGPIKKELSNPFKLDYLGTVWGKLYKKKSIKENDIKFYDLSVIGSAEDTLFNIELFSKLLGEVYILNDNLYHYWKGNRNSITSKYIHNFMEKRLHFFNRIKILVDSKEKKEALDNRICLSMMGIGLIECQNLVGHQVKIKNIKKCLDNVTFITSYRNLELKFFPIHWRCFYFFNKIKFAIGSYLILNLMNFMRRK